jgi:hypothetical protein
MATMDLVIVSSIITEYLFTAGTPGDNMYNLILATDASLKHNHSTAQNDDECQNANILDQEMVQGKLLICSYSLNFLFGISTFNNVMDTIKNLSAVGVVMTTTMDLRGINIPDAPFSVPAIIVLASNASKVKLLRTPLHEELGTV